MRRTPRFGVRSIVGAVAMATASLSLAACGGSSSGDAGEDGLTKVDVGVLPITSTAALQLGIKKGFFEEEGLDVETHVAQSGAALIPAIASGQYQFGFSNNMSLIIAHGKNLPVRIVRTANSADSDPKPSQEALFVTKESGIKSPKQLEGTTIAVNSLNNTPHLAVLQTLEEAGVDTSTVKFVEVGFPDMPLALEQGQVDAADISEPFTTVAKEDGMVDIAHPYRVLKQDLHLSSWFTTQTYIDQDSDAVESFARAVDKSNAYARAHTDEIREFVPTHLDVKPALAKRMAMPRYPEGTAEPQTLEMLAERAEHFGFIESAPSNLDDLIADIG